MKSAGRHFNLVPAKVMDSDVLGLSTEGSKGSPCYIVQWREAVSDTLVLVK